ncbi:MAG TPA: DinB family protein [Thermoanaerobaculia bacterium]|nr:DinB family protein [Thermoanaerobaculia bacterium]
MTLDDSIALLTRTPAALDALLRDLPDTWTDRNEGGDSWTVRETIGHLIFGELTDWIPRARMIVDHGDTRPFEPFDRLGHLPLIEGRSLPELLDEFARRRTESLEALRAMNLQPDDLAGRGRHPSLGSVTLDQLLATWPAHDLTHLHQITRVMAHQVRDAVGPWSAFMGVMQCNGHSG